jgi:coenzyme F420-reducing hydrogenase alpha subunit
MHTNDADISLEELSKIEGAASCNIKIRNGVVEECQFAIREMRRFFATATRGKDINSVPSQVSRICGTCSNAHLLASLKAIENGLGLVPSEQTKILRKLLHFGLIIRDHGLHLYVFSLPDLFHKNSILDFDENNPEEHRLLDDCFSVKNAGNMLGVVSGGRSVHAPLPKIGGTNSIPARDELNSLIPVLKETRFRILHLIKVFSDCPFELHQDFGFMALVDDNYTFLDGIIKTDDGKSINGADFMDRMEKTIMPYSQASGYKLDGRMHMVGALARININRGALHPDTRRDAAEALAKFPSDNIFHNNLAQAVEMLHAVDSACDLILSYQANPETVEIPKTDETTGIGIIEAPRGTLYHRYLITAENKIRRSKIIVPTGQNQSCIENAIRDWVSMNLDKPREEIEQWIEIIVRAFDPCMSCASHFLKLKLDRID